MDSPSYDKLNAKGFLIVENVLTKKEIDKVKRSIIKNTIDICFRDKGIEITSSEEENIDLSIFTDAELRKKLYGEVGEKCIWRNGNTREPLISKSCGMTNIHYNEKILKYITFNENIYDLACKVQGKKELVHAVGPERFCIKAKGSTDMPKHIDSNPFYYDVNYVGRIQSLVTLQVDNNPKTIRNSGTLCLLTYFHHFWDFVRVFFHPRIGHPTYRWKKDATSRFFLLPSSKKDMNDFDTFYFPVFKKYAVHYHSFLGGVFPEEKDILSFFQFMKEQNVKVPQETEKYIADMKWECLSLPPESMVFWHQYLPHYNVKNRLDTARICVYYNTFPVTKEWYTPLREGFDLDEPPFELTHREWVVRQFRRCEFYYGVDANLFPTKVVNKEEVEHLKKSGTLRRLSKFSRSGLLRQYMSGELSYYEEFLIEEE